MERFVITVNGWRPLTIITKRSILDFAAALDPPLLHMFSSKVRGGEAFAAEQKVREFKKLLFKTKALGKKLGKKIKPNKFIEKATNNLNITKTAKYDFVPEKIEAKSIASEQIREECDFYRLQKVKKDAARRSRYDNKRNIRFRRTLRDPLNKRELVNELVERLTKKRCSRKTVQILFIKDWIFVVRKRVKISDSEYFY